jgi:glycosyltransferase involved in cell wall biosynthesis
MNNIKLAIVMSTYYRKDNKSLEYLTNSLNSILSQTYQNYKLFLIGDKYEKHEEILPLISKFNNDSIYFENLPYAKERDKYIGYCLWSYGGTNAMNYGVNKALNEGYDYICHLDHDDWWYDNHLELINKCIIDTNSDWMCTKSTYNNPNIFLPILDNNDDYVPFLPKPCGLIHSSVCMNFRKIPLRYRDIFDETGSIGLPTDADLWERAKHYIEVNKLKSHLINKLTCRHDEEGYEKK